MNVGKGERTTVVLATILLALKFIWRLMPADEAPSSTLNALSILLELGMLVGVVGMVPRILRSLPEGAPRGGWIFLFVVAIVSGVGIFGIRLSGGPRVELPPRTSSTSTAAEGLPKQMHELVKAVDRDGGKLASTRWMKLWATEDPVQVRALSRLDFQEAREVFRVMREKIEQLLTLFAEAESKKIDVSTASTTAGLTRAETWRVALEGIEASYELLGLIDEHWEEWIADPSAAGNDVKAWRMEVGRLGNVSAEAAAQLHALITPGLEPMPPETVALRKKLRDLVDTWGPLILKFRNLRWINADDAQRRKLPRQDLLEAREASREILEHIDRVQKVFAEAESKKIDVASALTSKTVRRPEFWSASRTKGNAVAEKFGLIEKNWDDYVAHPFQERKSELKPWQREVERLDEIAKTATKGWEAPAIAAVPPSLIPTPPVASTPGTAPSRPSKQMEELILKTHLLPAILDYTRVLARLQETRWIKSPTANAHHPERITRADLHDANAELAKLIASIDKLRADLDAVTVPAPAAEKEYWRVKRETSVAFQQLSSLLEENWKEWHVSGIEPKKGEAKPWQKEASRLQGEVDKLKQFDGTSVLL